MTFIADATATTVGGARRAAHIEMRTSGGEAGSSTVSLPAGLADAVVSWAGHHLPQLRGQEIERIVDDLGALEAAWTDLADRSAPDERAAARAAVALLTDALWDAWARTNDCPLWKLIVNLSPEQLIRSLDLRWVEDVMPVDDALELLQSRVRGRSAREADLRREGYPVLPMVSLSAPDAVSRIEALSRAGWPIARIGLPEVEDASELAGVLEQLRRTVGGRTRLAVGPDRAWSPRFALDACSALAELDIDAIVDPVDPLDAVALAALRRRIAGLSRRIDIAAGNGLSRAVGVKQLLAGQAVDVCRFVPGRLGVSASITLLLVAARLRTPVALVAGGLSSNGRGTAGLTVALHLAAVDDIAIGASLDRRTLDLGDSPDLLAAALTSTPGRSRLPLSTGTYSRADLPGDEQSIPRSARR